MGTVDAPTPIETTTADQHLSFICDVHRGPSHDDNDALPLLATYASDASDDGSSTYSANNNNDEVGDEQASPLPPPHSTTTTTMQLLDTPPIPQSAKTEATRSSYMTNDTALSGLSDFPVPPNETIVSLDRVKDLLGKRRARAEP